MKIGEIFKMVSSGLILVVCETIINKWITLILTIALFTFTIMDYNNYEEHKKKYGYRDVTGVVYEKVGIGETQYRSSNVKVCYTLIVKDDITGKYVDFKVSPTKYVTHKIGDRIKFSNVSKDELEERYDKRVPYFILTGIACFIAFFFTLCNFSYDY